MIRRLLKNLGVYEGDAPAAHRAARARRLGDACRPCSTGRGRRPARGDRRRLRRRCPPNASARTRTSSATSSCNRSAACQQAVGQPRVLEVIEPLLGEDCHVIANTAWRNPADFAGGPWHCDAGPHIPRREGIHWDDRIPYPVFAIGAHIYLQDCARSPTDRPPSCPAATVPDGSRPFDRMYDPDLTYDGRPPVVDRGERRRRRAVRRPTSGTAACPPTADGPRPLLPAGALRSPRSSRSGLRTTDLVEPPLAGSDLTRQDGTGAHARRPARSVLLRRLTPPPWPADDEERIALFLDYENLAIGAREALGGEPARLPADRRRARRTGPGRRAPRLRRLVALLARIAASSPATTSS